MKEQAPEQETDEPPPARQTGEVGCSYVLGWFLIWFAAHVASYALVSGYLLDRGSQDGFAAAMGLSIVGCGTLGCLASYFVATISRRNWTFLAGAAVVGFGAGFYFLAAYSWGAPALIVDTVGYAFVCLAIGGAVMVFRERASRRARARASSTT